MDIKYVENNYQFIYRVSAVIFNEEQTKILAFHVEGRDFYMLPGGKVNQKEESIDAIKREMKEEIGYEDITFRFLGISEEFVESKGCYNQQINLIYYGILKEEIKELEFKGLEGDWILFKWIDVADLESCKIYPSNIKEAIKNPNQIYHWIENLTRK